MSTTFCSPTFIRQDNNFMFPRDSACEMPQVCSIDCASNGYQHGTHINILPFGSPRIQLITCPTHLVRSFLRMPPRSTGLETYLQWRSTQLALSKRWWNNVRVPSSPVLLYCCLHLNCPISRLKWDDGIHDARPGLCNPRCGRSHEFCRNYEVSPTSPFFPLNLIAG